MALENPQGQPQIVERTGLALVHLGERISAEPESAATLTSASNVINYYFPVEVVVIGAGTTDHAAETIYDALQRQFSALI